MSTLGPFPEQPLFHPRIPTLDLRDAIRLDHGLVPLDEEVDTFSEHPIIPAYPARMPARKSEWGVNGIWTSIVLVILLIVAWAINPAWVLGVFAAAMLLGVIAKRLR